MSNFFKTWMCDETCFLFRLFPVSLKMYSAISSFLPLIFPSTFNLVLPILGIFRSAATRHQHRLHL